MLKVELAQQHQCREHARRDLFAYIKDYDDEERVHSALKYLTPNQAKQRAN